MSLRTAFVLLTTTTSAEALLPLLPPLSHRLIVSSSNSALFVAPSSNLRTSSSLYDDSDDEFLLLSDSSLSAGRDDIFQGVSASKRDSTLSRRKQQRPSRKAGDYDGAYRNSKIMWEAPPDLFDLFDPQSDSKDIVIRRVRALSTVPNLKVLTSILHSWAKQPSPNGADDVGDRCYEVLKHLRSYSGNRGIGRPDNHLFSVVINAYARRGQPEKAEAVLEEMILEGSLVPDVVTFSCVLNAWAKRAGKSEEEDSENRVGEGTGGPAATGAPDKCMQLLSKMKRVAEQQQEQNTPKDSLTPAVVGAYNAAIEAFANRGQPNNAERMLRDMLMGTTNIRLDVDNVVLPDVSSFNSVLNAWSNSGANDAPERCMQLLTIMRQQAKRTGKKEHTPDKETYASVMNAYRRQGDAAKGEDMIRETLKTKVGPHDTVSIKNVLDSWDGVRPKGGRRLFTGTSSMAKVVAAKNPTKDLGTDVVAWSTVIDMYANRGQAHEAEALLREMIRSKEPAPNLFCFNSVLKAWSKSSSHEAPRRCHRLLIELKLLAQRPGHQHLAPDVVSYSTVIDTYAKRGRPIQAERLLTEMMRRGGGTKQTPVYPDVVAFNSVMNAWSKSDLSYGPDQCRRLLGEMQRLARQTSNPRLMPTVVTYTTVIHAYAVRGLAQEAESVLKEMLGGQEVPTEGGGTRRLRIVPNMRSFSAVMNAWAKSLAKDSPDRCLRLMSVMEKLAERQNRKDLLPNVVSYSCLVDAYASHGMAKEAEGVLNKMLRSSDGSGAAHQPAVLPNVVTYNGVMKAWIRYDPKDAPRQCQRLLEEMKQLSTKYGVRDLRPNRYIKRTMKTAEARAKQGRTYRSEGFVHLQDNEMDGSRITSESVGTGNRYFANEEEEQFYAEGDWNS